MTNLSKELCEVCNFSTLLFDPKKETIMRVYPDFTQPENFVKLFFLPLNNKIEFKIIGEVVIRNYVTFSIKDFLFNLIHLLKCDCDDNTFGIRKIIRAKEWMYE